MNPANEYINIFLYSHSHGCVCFTQDIASLENVGRTSRSRWSCVSHDDNLNDISPFA